MSPGGGRPRRGRSGARPGSARSGPHRDRAAGRASSRALGGEQVEGRQAVRELLLVGRRKVHELIVPVADEPSRGADELQRLAQELRIPVREVSRSKFESEARTEAPQGVIARAAPLEDVDLDDVVRSVGDRPPFLVALDGITDPGNLGAILRSAECAGATGVVLPRHRAAHVSPAAAKAAAGAIEHLPMAVVGGLPSALVDLKKHGVWVVGLDASGDQSVYDLPFGDEPVVLVVGSEGRGLARLTRERCDVLAHIPLAGRIGSLNAAAAAAIACFEIARRRA